MVGGKGGRLRFALAWCGGWEAKIEGKSRGFGFSVRLPPDETPHEIACPELDEDVTESLRTDLGRLFDFGDSDDDDDDGA